jgi:gliding motility-associated lipoprotein GldH
MKKFGIQFFIVCFFVLTFLACNKTDTFTQYKTISHASWDRDSLIQFTVPVKDTTQNHNLYINVRNDINYKYSNLWLFIDIIQPGDSTSVTDTLEVTLADPTGKWLGHGFGGVKTSETLFKQNVFFPVSGNYHIKIQHGMRNKILDGITEIGFQVGDKK